MRHLYALNGTDPSASYIIEKAKLFERRRCGHRPEDHPEPLSAEACISSVVDPKDSKTNKNRYVVASQELEVRKKMRKVKGVPLVYVNRSVMIMEPMSGATGEAREKEEGAKFRGGLKGRISSGVVAAGGKRKREEGGEEGAKSDDAPKKKKVFGGPKGPNPLAVKRSKKKGGAAAADTAKKTAGNLAIGPAVLDGETVPAGKRKRTRKHKGTEGVLAAVDPPQEEGTD